MTLQTSRLALFCVALCLSIPHFLGASVEKTRGRRVQEDDDWRFEDDGFDNEVEDLDIEDPMSQISTDENSMEVIEFENDFNLRARHEEESTRGKKVKGKKGKGKGKDKFGLSIISHATMDKLYILPELILRFTGNIVLGVWVQSANEKKRVQALMESYGTPRRVQLVFDIAQDENEQYPVNKLRNMAREKVNTSHFLMVDLDLLPSTLMQAVFDELDVKDKEADKLALVVPAFEYRRSIGTCRSNIECFQKIRGDLPRNKLQLNQCTVIERCGQFYGLNAANTHSTTDYPKWWVAEKPFQIPCFQDVRYEPYLILRADSAPIYNERFVGYGKNKIQHINHLRFEGYLFKVLPRTFVIHVPHKTSSSKRKWKQSGSDHRLSMDKLFYQFKKALEAEYKSSFRLSLCNEM